MKNDYIKNLEYLGFATRLKRISDMLMHDGRRLYKELGMDIEPNWYLIFNLLETRGELSVTDISEVLQFSHPSVITITNKMEKAGYLLSEKSASDNRKRVLRLSLKAKEDREKFAPVWAAATQGITEALEGLDALSFIDKLETRLQSKNFKQRAIESLHKKINHEK